MYRKFHKLRVRFAELEMTQNEAARRAGIATGTMTARMNGKYPFTATEMLALAKVLCIKPEEYGEYFFADAPQGKKKVG